MTPQLPDYLAAAKPTSAQDRAPWHRAIAPSYAGVFLWIVFYETLGSALPLGGLAAALIGLVLAAVVCYALFYYVFGMLGMQTGLPLYVVGSSTFGTVGGLLIPGIFMGLLQVGWFSVMVYFAARLILQAAGMTPVTLFDANPQMRGFSIVFLIVAVVWGYTFATIGALGIKYIARVGTVFALVPIAMLLITAISAAPGLDSQPRVYDLPSHPLAAVMLIVQLTVGYFATAGAAGVDYGMNVPTWRDVSLGGIVGIALPILVAGGLALITVAGASGLPGFTGFTFSEALRQVSPRLARIMFALFAISTIPPSGFCAFVMGNSLSTMIPRVPRLTWTLGGATIGIVLAVLGLAGNLEPFFGLIGASFGPVCGAMTADWLLSGRRWAGPRAGISLPGYAAWLIGFVVGISNNAFVASLLGRSLLPEWHPTSVYSFIVGFAVYALLAKVLDWEPDPAALPSPQ